MLKSAFFLIYGSNITQDHCKKPELLSLLDPKPRGKTMSTSCNYVITTLRQMILSGELPASARLAEIPTAEKLGVSRTPIRIAFRTLEQEGLLTKLPGRGYEVSSVSSADIEDALEVRGVLEGLAARQAAEKGLSESQQAELTQLLQAGDKLFTHDCLTETDLEHYHAMNRRFHQIIIEAAQNSAIQAALSRNEHLPFASVSALAFDKNNMAHETKRFAFAHQQHHHAVFAIMNGQGARAEGIMREHANATLGYTPSAPHRDSHERLTVINQTKYSYLIMRVKNR
ncbi:MAG: GntR family transcriptional regulator [Reinekea sp.]